MVKRNIKWIVEKNKKKTHINKNKLNIQPYFKKSEYLKNIKLNTFSKKNLKLNKKLCLLKGKYNNNFKLLNMSRHSIKYLLTWKIIFINKNKW